VCRRCALPKPGRPAAPPRVRPLPCCASATHPERRPDRSGVRHTRQPFGGRAAGRSGRGLGMAHLARHGLRSLPRGIVFGVIGPVDRQIRASPESRGRAARASGGCVATKSERRMSAMVECVNWQAGEAGRRRADDPCRSPAQVEGQQYLGIPAVARHLARALNDR
jgi:hypothetical protein